MRAEFLRRCQNSLRQTSPEMLQLSWALQNDRWKFSFVKATNVVGKKMARNGYQMPNF